jgi:acetylornithine aminotransferase/acetylornithine/N-succinyldiaminopimelate aminotransferase
MRAEAARILPTYERNSVMFVRGKGVYLWDSTGRKYLDFLSGIGVNALGYGHPAIQQVIADQSAKLIHISNLFFHQYQAELAKRLTKISGLDKAFFCNSGTEAWEGALKLARAFARGRAHNGHKPKWRVIAMDNSFHGRTFGSLATTGQPKYRAPFAPLMPGVAFVRFNDVEDLKRQFDDSVCAVCLETIQGEGGIRPVSPEFLREARQLSARTGALLVLDEIQCGLGRTGRHFAYQQYGVQPDIVTVAKPLAAGLPLGAILVSSKVAGCVHPGMHGSTFGGGPLACAVAIEFLKQENQLLPRIRKIGRYFRRELEGLARAHAEVLEVRGSGLMLALELNSAELAKAVSEKLLQEGIIINRTHETVLRFLPPYIVERKHIDQVVSALHSAFSTLAIGPARPVASKKRSKS